MTSRIYYFDHAASSWPKPPGVAEAMVRAVTDYAANPGRGGHRMAVQAGKAILEARMNLAKLFGIDNPNDIAFTLNATHALNMALSGCLRPGDHVLYSGIEHNSVRRPIEQLTQARGIEAEPFAVSPNGEVDLDRLRASMRRNTKLIACSHGSNLLGSILPIEEIGRIAKEHGALLLVDGAQTAGTYPIDVKRMGIDLLAFPGHKGLLGPQGTGGLYIRPDLDLEPLMTGGTGSQSENVRQPDVRPDRYESGTLNTPGIAGLNEGVKYVLQQSVEAIHRREWQLVQRLMQGLLEIDGLQILGPALGEHKTGIVSFVAKDRDPSEIAFWLDRKFGIAVRAGFHCTPLGHATAGSSSTGAVRASIGWNTTEDEIDYFVDSVQSLISSV